MTDTIPTFPPVPPEEAKMMVEQIHLPTPDESFISSVVDLSVVKEESTSSLVPPVVTSEEEEEEEEEPNVIIGDKVDENDAPEEEKAFALALDISHQRAHTVFENLKTIPGTLSMVSSFRKLGKAIQTSASSNRRRSKRNSSNTEPKAWRDENFSVDDISSLDAAPFLEAASVFEKWSNDDYIRNAKREEIKIDAFYDGI